MIKILLIFLKIGQQKQCSKIAKYFFKKNYKPEQKNKKKSYFQP
jgi:hypothetical protein